MGHTRFKIMILILILIVLVGCTNQSKDNYILAHKGIIDLSKVEIDNQIISLDGEWKFHWKELIGPEEIDEVELPVYIGVPSTWNKYPENVKKSGKGYGTYELSLRMKEDEELALKVPRLHTAYKLWINGELMATGGKLGESREDMRPQYLPQTVFFKGEKGENKIIIQISNFYHRNGGMLESIQLGKTKQILGLRYRGMAKSSLIFGCLLMMGIYHLSLFINRKKDLYNLYFGLGCILFGVRALMYGENIFIYSFPNFSWEVAHKVVTLSYYLGVPILLRFFHSIFPRYLHTSVLKLTDIIGISFGIIVLTTPAIIFTSINPIYQIWTIIIIVYVFFSLVRATVNKEKDSWILLLGATTFIIGSLSEIIFHSVLKNDTIIEWGSLPWLRSLLISDNFSSLGLLVFAVVNALLLARRFSDALSYKEILTEELITINENLDKMVLQRTEELVKSKEKIEEQKLELEEKNQQLQELSLRDSLTQLWNRRKYDEIIKMEWYRNLRYKRPITLIFIDIDYFKEYNDRYGHIKGDECLTTVAQYIENFFSRATDVVARYGGDEFIVVLSETKKSDVIKMAEKLREEIEKLRIQHLDSPINDYVTVSIGVASIIPSIDLSPEDLLNKVDEALYKAKNQGRNQVVFFREPGDID